MHRNEIARDPYTGPATRRNVAATARQPAIDIIETATSYVVLADLPGVAPDAIDIELRDNVLSLRGSRTAHATDGQPRREGGSGGEFARRIPLPATIDGDAIKARSEHGTLRITVPKRAEMRRRQIAVEAA